MLDVRGLACTVSRGATAFLWVPVAAVLAGGCAGTGLPPSDLVSVQIAPDQATVPVGGTVELRVVGIGFGNKVTQIGTIQGQNGCWSWVNPPNIDCPSGYVIEAVGDHLPISATYYAPTTPGTYHILLEVVLWGEGLHTLQKTAAATMTVTP